MRIKKIKGILLYLLLIFTVLSVVSSGCIKKGNQLITANITKDNKIEKDESVKILAKDPAGCTWVDVISSVNFGEDDTKHQVKAQAISEARRIAMERFLGIKIEHRFLDFQQAGLKDEINLTESLLRVTQLGKILDERIISLNPTDVGNCKGCGFTAHIQTCIVPQKLNSDSGFKVNLSLNRNNFKEGDEAIINIKLSRDAYIYIYNVDVNWNGELIFPNSIADHNRILANSEFIYPDETLKKRGVHLIAKLLDGKKVTAEMIRVIATKTPLSKDLLDKSSGNFLNFMQRLNATDIEWVDDANVFFVNR